MKKISEKSAINLNIIGNKVLEIIISIELILVIILFVLLLSKETYPEQTYITYKLDIDQIFNELHQIQNLIEQISQKQKLNQI